jgi:hypothetical protein
MRGFEAVLLVLSVAGCGVAPETIPEEHSWAQSATPTPTGVLYYGGPVLSQVEVVDVFWGPSVNPQVTAWAGPFFSAVTASPYFDMLQEYDTDLESVGGTPGTNQTIYRGSWMKDVTITPSVTGTAVDDTAIVAELGRQITAGVLPPPDANTVYMTFFPPGMTVTLEGLDACGPNPYCAYHNMFQHGGTATIYGVVPDMSGGCSVCGPGDLIGNNENSASHELIEATTDPQVNIYGTGPIAAPYAWISNDQNADEVADLCLGQDGTAAGYLVQKIWSNKLGACVDHNPAYQPLPSPGETPDPTPTAAPAGPGEAREFAGCGCDLGSSSRPGAAALIGVSALLLGVLRRRSLNPP